VRAGILSPMARKTTNKLQETLIQYLAQREDVPFAYLFGSYAEGRANRLSDLDVAVYLKQHSRSEREEVRLTLTTDIMKAVNMNNVDVLILNDAPPLVAYRATGRGIVLKDSVDSARAEFEVRCLGNYLDFKYYMDRHNAALRKRIREE